MKRIMNIHAFLFLFFLLLCPRFTTAQSTFEIGLKVAPSISQYHWKGKPFFSSSVYDFVYRTSFGLEISKEFKRLKYFGSLMLLNQGTKFQVLETTVDQPEGINGETFEININNKSLIFLLGIDYIFHLGERSKLLLGGGGYLGNIYSEKATIRDEVTNRDNETPNDFHSGVFIDLGFKQNIYHQFSLLFKPTWYYQLKDIFNNKQDADRVVQTSLAFELCLFYHFN